MTGKRYFMTLGRLDRTAQEGNTVTTYAYALEVDDNERMALEAALDFYVAHCGEKCVPQPPPPYWTHRDACQSIRRKLRNAPGRQTSGNDFEAGGNSIWVKL